MRGVAVAVVVAGFTAMAPEAVALTVSLDVNPALVKEISGGTVGDMRYKLDNTNWDMAIAPGGSPVSGFASRNLGNVGALSGNTYDFKVQYTAGVGYQYTIFGTFGSTTDPVVSWTTSDGDKNGKSPTGSYNAILLSARADANRTMSVSDLAFSITGASTSGALDTSMSASNSAPQTDVQWLVADGNLSVTSWTLLGKFTATTALTSCSECLKFDVFTKNVEVVPIPAALPMLLAAAAGLGFAGWRRQRASV